MGRKESNQTNKQIKIDGCWVCLPGVSWWFGGSSSRFVILVFPDHTHLLFLSLTKVSVFCQIVLEQDILTSLLSTGSTLKNVLACPINC